MRSPESVYKSPLRVQKHLQHSHTSDRLQSTSRSEAPARSKVSRVSRTPRWRSSADNVLPSADCTNDELPHLQNKFPKCPYSPTPVASRARTWPRPTRAPRGRSGSTRSCAARVGCSPRGTCPRGSRAATGAHSPGRSSMSLGFAAHCPDWLLHQIATHRRPVGPL